MDKCKKCKTALEPMDFVLCSKCRREFAEWFRNNRSKFPANHSLIENWIKECEK